MDIEFLVKITARAWALPILAAFQDGVPGRQAALIHATGAGRAAFGQSLDHLIELGLVERTPGHGHPFRPEFRLSAAGQKAAVLAQKVQRLSPEGSRPLLRKAWTLPVLGALQQPSPFSRIKRSLPITDRALSQSLQRLELQRWVARSIIDGRPPRPVYQAAGEGFAIATILNDAQGATRAL